MRSKGGELVHHIKRWLSPPVFPDDENKTRRAKLLNLALINVLVLIPILVISNFLGGNTPPTVILVDILAFLLCLIFCYWLRLGRIGLASFGLMALGFIGTTAGIAILGTVRAPMTALYLLLVITAGLLFELRGLIATTTISSVLVGGLIIAENMGLLPTPNYSVTITQWITLTVLFGWAGSLTFSSIQSMHNALDTANKELVNRKQAEAELAKHRDRLEELVKEATAELEAKNVELSKEITERKKMEQALVRSNQELQQFAYIASHDLQEPLRMISSYLQLIEQEYRGKLDSEADEFIGYAVDGANRLQNMINDLLAYSRIETRKLPFERINSETILAQALLSLKVAVDESGAQVTHDPLPVVFANGTQMIQVFQNLISNAIKFRGPSPPVVHISARLQGKDWIFSVQDNGIGIEPQYSDQIFVIFKRLHGRKHPGTGIGLALCKRIIERHGGKIWFESEPGKGTTFNFSIPEREAMLDDQ